MLQAENDLRHSKQQSCHISEAVLLEFTENKKRKGCSVECECKVAQAELYNRLPGGEIALGNSQL